MLSYLALIAHSLLNLNPFSGVRTSQHRFRKLFQTSFKIKEERVKFHSLSFYFEAVVIASSQLSQRNCAGLNLKIF